MKNQKFIIFWDEWVRKNSSITAGDVWCEERKTTAGDSCSKKSQLHYRHARGEKPKIKTTPKVFKNTLFYWTKQDKMGERGFPRKFLQQNRCLQLLKSCSLQIIDSSRDCPHPCDNIGFVLSMLHCTRGAQATLNCSICLNTVLFLFITHPFRSIRFTLPLRLFIALCAKSVCWTWICLHAAKADKL